MQVVNEQQFCDFLQSKISGTAWDRALTFFRDCPNLSFDTTSVLMHAADQGKVEEVLDILEEHYQKHLCYQHPEIRGTVSKNSINPTETMFLYICHSILGLQPNPA